MSEARYPNKYILSMNAVPYWMVWIQWIGGFLDGISGAYQATKNGVPIFCGIVSNGQIVAHTGDRHRFRISGGRTGRNCKESIYNRTGA